MKTRFSQNNQGFTLVELIAAVAIMAFGVSAILFLQATSLKMQKNNRDTVIANNLGKQTMSVLRIDALKWENDPSETSYFDNGTYKPRSNSGAQYWIPYTPTPVNFQMKHSTASDNAGINAAFCIFYSYRWAGEVYVWNTMTLGGTALTDEAFEVTVSVIWPRNWNGLDSVIQGSDTYSYYTFFKDCGNVNLGNPDFTEITNMLFDTTRLPTIITKFKEIRFTSFILKNTKEISR